MLLQRHSPDMSSWYMASSKVSSLSGLPAPARQHRVHSSRWRRRPAALWMYQWGKQRSCRHLGNSSSASAGRRRRSGEIARLTVWLKAQVLGWREQADVMAVAGRGR